MTIDVGRLTAKKGQWGNLLKAAIEAALVYAIVRGTGSALDFCPRHGERPDPKNTLLSSRQ